MSRLYKKKYNNDNNNDQNVNKLSLNHVEQ